ncbi:MAG: alpha/beta hydrolase-fold protein [Bacteroidetes bacterium]|nr:alpha/beta hydrolase-fold protein [Bacteroidota bacterium]
MKTRKTLFITILTTLLILAQFIICHAQLKKSDFAIGDKISFESKILHERRSIVVIPPYNYKDWPDEKFPVVYVLDPGNNLFATFGIVNYYSDMLKIMPRMIIVGVVSGDREKDYLPAPSKEQPTGGGADKFLRFIDSELVPFIDSAYPASSERCIIGHSAGGLFAVYALEHKPDLFSSFICIDPSLWYDNHSCTSEMPGFLKKNETIRKSIFISLSNEKEMGVFPFIEVLEKYAPAGIKWDYIHYKNETHNSLGFKSICAGFEMIYKDWKTGEKTK